MFTFAVFICCTVLCTHTHKYMVYKKMLILPNIDLVFFFTIYSECNAKKIQTFSFKNQLFLKRLDRFSSHLDVYTKSRPFLYHKKFMYILALLKRHETKSVDCRALFHHTSDFIYNLTHPVYRLVRYENHSAVDTINREKNVFFRVLVQWDYMIFQNHNHDSVSIVDFIDHEAQIDSHNKIYTRTNRPRKKNPNRGLYAINIARCCVCKPRCELRIFVKTTAKLHYFECLNSNR